MSSTRKAKDDSVFRQDRYASSAEFERGLVAYLVAKRCSVIDSAEDRELIWWIQYQSHEPGGIDGLASQLIAAYPERIQTEAMVTANLKPGMMCDATTVKKIRVDLGGAFPLKGEVQEWALSPIQLLDYPEECAAERRLAEEYPLSYASDLFFKCCQDQAESELADYLKQLCLDPSLGMNAPDYFAPLIGALRDFKRKQSEQRGAGAVVTSLGKKVYDVLDYTFYSRGLTLVSGEARRGKSHSARLWCEMRAGQARFVEVPPTNDDSSFFRAMARGLGLGSFLRYKVTELRERVEAVLLTGDLLLVLDEAHRLWPQKNLRFGFPGRINWVMTMANHNVPICAISTPQFIESQRAAEQKGQWNAAQLTGRITHYEDLPRDLSREDLIAVAKSVLPEANPEILRLLAIYALSSSRYLAAIDSISKRARFIATRSGRPEASTEDVRQAMNESVIPSDSALLRALAGDKSEPPAPEPEMDTPPSPRSGRMAMPGRQTAPEVVFNDALKA